MQSLLIPGFSIKSYTIIWKEGRGSRQPVRCLWVSQLLLSIAYFRFNCALAISFLAAFLCLLEGIWKECPTNITLSSSFTYYKKAKGREKQLLFLILEPRKKEKDLLCFPLWCKGKECGDPYLSILIEQALKGVLCTEKGSLILQDFLFSNAAAGPVCTCAVSGEFYSDKWFIIKFANISIYQAVVTASLWIRKLLLSFYNFIKSH